MMLRIESGPWREKIGKACFRVFDSFEINKTTGPFQGSVTWLQTSLGTESHSVRKVKRLEYLMTMEKTMT